MQVGVQVGLEVLQRHLRVLEQVAHLVGVVTVLLLALHVEVDGVEEDIVVGVGV